MASDFEYIARMRDESHRRLLLDLQSRLAHCYLALAPLENHVRDAHHHDHIVAYVGNRPEAVFLSINQVRAALSLIEAAIDTTNMPWDQPTKEG